MMNYTEMSVSFLIYTPSNERPVKHFLQMCNIWSFFYRDTCYLDPFLGDVVLSPRKV